MLVGCWNLERYILLARECPPYVREYVGHQVWTAIRNPEVNGDDMDHLDSGNTTNHTYDIMKLIQDVTSKANAVIQELHKTLTAAEVEKLPRYHPISHFAIKNGRRKMEDRHVIIHDLSTLYGLNFKQPHAYYGVFDGHAGIDAAVYSAAHLHQYMIQNPQYETNPEAALKHAFHITDTNFIKKASKEKLKGGTTAVVALVREKRLVVAWLGDSQALLVRRRTPVRMVEPHKPELPIERERVEEMGGCVLNIQGTWRVLGQLAVSRAIGDREYKPFVSSECDIKSLEIEGDEDFLILACDGLWDTLSAEAAVNVVYAYLTRNDGDTDGVGRCLVEAARNTGSDDNITAVVVFLRPVATIMEEEAQRIAQGQVPEPVPEAVLCKDSTPSSINAIFTPPVNNQFDPNNETPAFNFYDNDLPAKMDTEEAATPASLGLQMQQEPMEGSEAPNLSAARDSDSDEGIAAQGDNEQAFNPHEAPTPTAEEVDAALAELDSIPDEVCEAGDVEEEDEEEEEWSYYRMDLQTQPQAEDVLVPGSSAPLQDSEVMDQDHGKVSPSTAEDQPPQEQESEKIQMSFQPDLEQPVTKSPEPFQAVEHSLELSKESNLMESSITNVGEYLDNTDPPSSPPAPGSPRSVEGFVTSVELNTPEESLGTNFPTSHTQDLNGSGVGQPSGPFSVYVSSSPEPVSLDPLQTSGDFNSVSDMANGQVENETDPAKPEDFSPVEIVHAQSTVEVLASPQSEKESEVPSEMESNLFDMETSKVPVNQMSDLTFIPEPVVEPVAEVPVPVFIEEGTPVSEGEPEIPHEFSTNVQPATEIITADLLSKEEVEAHETETSFRVEDTPSPLSPAPERAPMSPESMSPILAPDSPCMKPEVVSSPEPEPAPAPMSPEVEVEEFKPMESSPRPTSPVAELQAPESPFKEVAPVSESPVLPASPEPAFLLEEPSPALNSQVEESPMSPVEEPAQIPVSAAAISPDIIQPEPSPAPVSPIMEPEPVSVSPAVESSPVPPVAEVLTPSPILVPEPSVLEPEPEPEPAPVVTKEPEPEVEAPVAENKDEILINNGTVVIPVVPQEEVKTPEPEVVKSPAKSTKAAADKPGKPTSARSTPGRAMPAKTTPSARTATKPAEKKPTPLRSVSKPSSTTRPAAEKTTPTTRPTASKTTPTRQPAAAKPAAKPLPKTTTTKPATAAPKPTEKKVPKPATQMAPRAPLTKPSTATSRPTTTRPATATARTTATTTTTAAKRPVSAPARKVEKADSTKVNGTTAKPAPRPTPRPAPTSTVTRKPLSSSAKPVPEKETKNTTNRILSTTAKSTQKASPGTARALPSKTGQSTLTKTAPRVNGTSTTTTTAKARATSVTKSSTTTTRTTGVGTKKTMMTKTSGTKTKTTSAAASAKVEKSEVTVSSVANGENKIAHEETSVEVIEKCAAEDILQCSTTEQVINTEPVELIVNGDH
ncbi:proteoglycan 4-like isoform X3 [Eriocheir sinensis]|uniref:proteoglycan 4-like isoform X3 n=1 Tax=Eriocheir sinensis TaxID=95602 RepID=UPI0021C844EA|nr:proteoglycan 4-like isoform X3 [Eriocheir sinensis]